jgi:hypothetical protein
MAWDGAGADRTRTQVRVGLGRMTSLTDGPRLSVQEGERERRAWGSLGRGLVGRAQMEEGEGRRPLGPSRAGKGKRPAWARPQGKKMEGKKKKKSGPAQERKRGREKKECNSNAFEFEFEISIQIENKQ